jgi:putative phosphoribosyl transferase
MPTRFRDRYEAGKILARHLTRYAARPDTVVLALPRGGVPVAFEIARALHAPLDVLLVRKLGVPGHEELAMGAVASGGARFFHRETVEQLGITDEQLEAVTRAEEQELVRRERAYRGGGPRQPLQGRTVVLVDDGLATGASMRVAIDALRCERPAGIIVAVPVGEPFASEDLSAYVDEVVCALTPENFVAVSCWYDEFSQTSDAEVCELLRTATSEHAESDFDTAPTLPS